MSTNTRATGTRRRYPDVAAVIATTEPVRRDLVRLDHGALHGREVAQHRSLLPPVVGRVPVGGAGGPEESASEKGHSVRKDSLDVGCVADAHALDVCAVDRGCEVAFERLLLLLHRREPAKESWHTRTKERKDGGTNSPRNTEVLTALPQEEGKLAATAPFTKHLLQLGEVVHEALLEDAGASEVEGDAVPLANDLCAAEEAEGQVISESSNEVR